MGTIDETHLPGVGVRHEFETGRGERVGVLNKLSGERELLIYSRQDPDACSRAIRLGESEAERLAQLLGVTQVTRNLEAIREAVGGLQVEWLEIQPGSPFGGKTIGDTELRTRTGVSVVAVMQGDSATPSPGPEHQIGIGDTLLVVGTLDGVRAAAQLLRGA